MRSWVPSRIRGLLSIYPYVFQSSLWYCRILSNLEQQATPPDRLLPCSFLLRRRGAAALPCNYLVRHRCA